MTTRMSTLWNIGDVVWGITTIHLDGPRETCPACKGQGWLEDEHGRRGCRGAKGPSGRIRKCCLGMVETQITRHVPVGPLLVVGITLTREGARVRARVELDVRRYRAPQFDDYDFVEEFPPANYHFWGGWLRTREEALARALREDMDPLASNHTTWAEGDWDPSLCEHHRDHASCRACGEQKDGIESAVLTADYEVVRLPPPPA